MKTVNYVFFYTIASLLLSGCQWQINNADPIWVYINKGAIQCESTGMPLSDSAKTLTDNNIAVLGSQCGAVSGMAFIALCGSANGDINLHLINANQLTDAQALQFSAASSLSTEGGEGIGKNKGYVVHDDCPAER